MNEHVENICIPVIQQLQLIFSADRCVCCGEIIPEGQQLCYKCMNSKTNKVQYKGDYRHENY